MKIENLGHQITQAQIQPRKKIKG